ncbi:hypothetical protein CHUAL_013087 [Chamberlinius hualienensis]
MTLEIEVLIEVVTIVCKNENIKVAVHESAKGGLLAGAGAFAGGLLGGPVGIAIGATVGGITGAYLSSGKFKSIPMVITEMPSHQQHDLARRLENVLNGIDIYDVVTLTTFIMSNSTLRMKLLGMITEYVKKELHMDIVD